VLDALEIKFPVAAFEVDLRAILEGKVLRRS